MKLGIDIKKNKDEIILQRTTKETNIVVIVNQIERKTLMLILQFLF